jgi:hypothetical protein
MNVYGIYYYYITNSTSKVKLLCLCSTIDYAIECINNNFINFAQFAGNTLTCVFITKNIPCILWVSKYTINSIIIDCGKSCDQPHDAINIIDML